MRFREHMLAVRRGRPSGTVGVLREAYEDGVFDFVGKLVFQARLRRVVGRGFDARWELTDKKIEVEFIPAGTGGFFFAKSQPISPDRLRGADFESAILTALTAQENCPESPTSVVFGERE